MSRNDDLTAPAGPIVVDEDMCRAPLAIRMSSPICSNVASPAPMCRSARLSFRTFPHLSFSPSLFPSSLRSSSRPEQ